MSVTAACVSVCLLLEVMVIVIAKLTHHIHKWTGRPGGGRGSWFRTSPDKGEGWGLKIPDFAGRPLCMAPLG